MDLTTVESLVERVDRLELENSWLKRVGAIAIFATLGLVAAGSSVFRGHEINAQKFVLNDNHGNPRAKLELRADGSPSLRFLNNQGTDQVVLRAERDGTSSLEYYQDQSLRASLSNLSGVGSSINLLNRSPRSRAEIFMRDEGTSGMAFNRELRGVSMNVQNDGTSKVSLTDQVGEDRAGMIVSPDGTLTDLAKPYRPKNNYTEADASGNENVRALSPRPKLQRSNVPAQERSPSHHSGGVSS